MNDLLHPPAHRGPLISAGALTLSVGVATFLARFEPAVGVTTAIAAALCAACLWLALQGATSGPPPAFASLLLVLGLGWLGVALGGVGDLANDDEPLGAGTVTWVSLVVAALAAWASRRRSSAVAALIAALALGAALLSAWQWIFEPDAVTPYRWLLLLLAVLYGVASLPLRGTSLRHSEQMVNAAGVAILAIPLSSGLIAIFGTPSLPSFFEGVVLAGGLGLVAYATADKAPGPAYLGLANLAAFALLAGPGEDELIVWPLLLMGVGLVMLLAGLRPRRPLPPEPGSSTRPDDLPLTIRVQRD